MTTNKTLDYYLALPYTIEVVPDMEEGGWVMRVKELPGCLSQADRWEDVLPMIEEAKRLWLEVALEHGHTIPEPKPMLA